MRSEVILADDPKTVNIARSSDIDVQKTIITIIQRHAAVPGYLHSSPGNRSIVRLA
jgi:hypothetical protein